MTFRELVYIITDLSKTISDDSNFNQDHILFLACKYRNYIINSQYLNLKKTIPASNYQTICIDVVPTDNNICGVDNALRSVEPIPNILPLGTITVSPSAGFQYGKFSYVPYQRYKYTGNSRFANKTQYVTIGPDNYLYIKSNSHDVAFIDKVCITGIFDDILNVAKIGECMDCDYLDTKFPLEDAFVNSLIQLVVNDITGGAWRLRDTDNDAYDSTDQLAQAITRYTTNSFKNMIRPNANNNRE